VKQRRMLNPLSLERCAPSRSAALEVARDERTVMLRTELFVRRADLKDLWIRARVADSRPVKPVGGNRDHRDFDWIAPTRKWTAPTIVQVRNWSRGAIFIGCRAELGLTS